MIKAFLDCILGQLDVDVLFIIFNTTMKDCNKNYSISNNKLNEGMRLSKYEDAVVFDVNLFYTFNDYIKDYMHKVKGKKLSIFGDNHTEYNELLKDALILMSNEASNSEFVGKALIEVSRIRKTCFDNNWEAPFFGGITSGLITYGVDNEISPFIIMCFFADVEVTSGLYDYLNSKTA